MKKLLVFLLIIITMFTFAACKEKCSHIYDNDCDTTCNLCDEKRTVSGHDYLNATCTTSEKCKICGITNGNPLEHQPEEDDGDCTTEVKCIVCGQVCVSKIDNHSPIAGSYSIIANGKHSFECSSCGEVIENHTFDTKNECYCGASIEITDLVYCGDQATYDATTNTYTIFISSNSTQKADVSIEITGENFEYFTSENNLLVIKSVINGVEETNFLNGYYVSDDSKYIVDAKTNKDGYFAVYQYSNDGGQTWSAKSLKIEVKCYYDVAVGKIENGSVAIDKNSAVAGDIITLTATANENYVFASWIVKDASGNLITVEDNSFIMPASNVTVAAIFETAQHVHEFGDWVIIKDATCTEEGEKARYCSCKDVETSRIEMFPHDFKNGICQDCNVSALALDYIQAVPENQGVKNAIDRAYLLTDVEWTTLGNVPGLRKNGEVIYFEEGVVHKGIPYSGVTSNDCYVGLNVSLESYLTALKNPNSVLYTENLQSTNSKAATYFGTVCSKFVQYALDVPGSYNTHSVPTIPGMDKIASEGKYTVDQIKLGDVVLYLKVHTTMCTNILYDKDGNVAFIEISEATYPTTRRKLWSPSEFYDYFASYQLYRYQYLSSTPVVPTVTVQEEYSLMPRFGDKYNYPISTKGAVVDVLKSGYDTAVIKHDGVIVDTIELNGATTFTFDCNIPGNIEMYLQKANGTKSESVYACVVKSSVKVTDVTSYSQGKMKVEFSGTSGTPLYVQFVGQTLFCSIKGQTVTAELSFSPSKVTTLKIRVAYQNEYGIYLSGWVPFTTEPVVNPSSDPLLSQATYYEGHNLLASSYKVLIQSGKEGYFTFDKIPVKAKETYYAAGATRMWFLDINGNPIKTINASKETVPYQFTTPAGTAYMSIAYGPNTPKDTLSIKVLHNYKDGVCLGCGEAQS